MELVDFFKENFESLSNVTDYKIKEFSKNFYVGIDKNSAVVIVIKSNIQSGRPYNIKTKALSLECNAKVTFSSGTQENVHILKCLLHNKKDKEIFLEVAKLFISDNYSDNYIIETFNTLQNFFSNEKELSDNELTGFYAELYTIYKFHDSLKIEQFWQSHDRMKFDFSFSEKLKLEIKSTAKENRIHHFLHEQINSTYYDIYVLSYLFRYDDKGLSLYDLIKICKSILSNYKELSMRLKYIEKNTNIERLKELKYNQIYTDEHMHIFSAKDIPKFAEQTPSGVSKAEYDSSLENIDFLDVDSFIREVKNSLLEEKNV
ncbi:MAG: PD-(D/E)XK motif protein [Treponema sp.]|nr:PD-(D/E)XK motif protein [Treponema sp.]